MIDVFCWIGRVYAELDADWIAASIVDVQRTNQNSLFRGVL